LDESRILQVLNSEGELLFLPKQARLA